MCILYLSGQLVRLALKVIKHSDRDFMEPIHLQFELSAVTLNASRNHTFLQQNYKVDTGRHY